MQLIFRNKSQGRQLKRRRDLGASLVEVLVSIVISSLGLLALAGVNAASIRYTKMSQYRATATQLANDIGERMRANKGTATPATGFFSGAYDYTTDFAGQATVASLPAQLCDQSTSVCTPAQIATLDLAQWRILVRSQLPEGSVFMIRQAGQVAMDMWVVWRDPGMSSDDAPAAAGECPTGLNAGDDSQPESIRCSFFRINL